MDLGNPNAKGAETGSESAAETDSRAAIVNLVSILNTAIKSASEQFRGMFD